MHRESSLLEFAKNICCVQVTALRVAWEEVGSVEVHVGSIPNCTSLYGMRTRTEVFRTFAVTSVRQDAVRHRGVYGVVRLENGPQFITPSGKCSIFVRAWSFRGRLVNSRCPRMRTMIHIVVPVVAVARVAPFDRSMGGRLPCELTFSRGRTSQCPQATRSPS